MHGALAELDRLARQRDGEWLVGTRLTQADITTSCVYGFVREALGVGAAADAARYPGLAQLGARSEALPAFAAARAAFSAPRRAD